MNNHIFLDSSFLFLFFNGVMTCFFFRAIKAKSCTNLLNDDNARSD